MKQKIINSKISKAIIDRWGHEVAQDPRDNWGPTKEALYLEQIREIEDKKTEADEDEKVLVDGVLIPKKLINRDNSKNCICTFCKKYSLEHADDLYITKFKACKRCFIQHIEGREDKWKENSSNAL